MTANSADNQYPQTKQETYDSTAFRSPNEQLGWRRTVEGEVRLKTVMNVRAPETETLNIRERELHTIGKVPQ